MAERLHAELAALPALGQVSVAQLRDLAWKTKELVLVALFRENASSAAVAEKLVVLAKDRRLERKAEKLADPVDRDAIRKKEESFRSDFMQIAATELARLGAPALITWQKLVFDKECCAQAFRLLLTRIKSSRRISNRGNNEDSIESEAPRRRVLRQHSNGSSKGGDEEPDNPSVWGDDRSENSSRLGTRASVTHINAKRFPTKQSVVASTASNRDWNFDTISSSPREEDYGDEVSENQSFHARPVPPSFTGPGISVERTAPVRQSSSFAAKFKKNQLQMLQHENASLTEENAKLRQEIEHLESLVALLQGTNGAGNNDGAMDTFDTRRMRLLQAQNVQLQRQISILEDTISGFQQAEASLISVVHRWKDVVETAQQDAKSAGADQKNGSDASKWMFAVPQQLLTELSRVEEHIHSASLSAGSLNESKLRIGDREASFLRDNQTSVQMSDRYGGDRSALRQLQPSRVKILEDQLARVGNKLTVFSIEVLETAPLPSATADPVDTGDPAATASELVKSIKDLLLDVAAFGVVVPTPSASLSFDYDRLPVIEQSIKVAMPQILKAFSIPTSSMSIKERDKHIKILLKQLQACYSAIENDAKICRKEALYWKGAWRTQADLVRDLVGKVNKLGYKKLAWIHENIMQPMGAVVHAFEGFQRAHQEGTTRNNPFLPLLVETLTTQHAHFRESLDNWQTYSLSTQSTLDTLVDDFKANLEMLSRNPKQDR